MKIRRANIGDALGIKKLLIRTWIKAYADFIPISDLKKYHSENYSVGRIREIIQNKLNDCFVVLKGDEVYGWLRMHEDDQLNKYFLTSLYIHPDIQKHGIGNKLIKLAFRRAVIRDFDEIWIGVMTQNSNALHIYEKAGFKFEIEELFAMGDSQVPHKIGVKKLSK